MRHTLKHAPEAAVVEDALEGHAAPAPSRSNAVRGVVHLLDWVMVRWLLERDRRKEGCGGVYVRACACMRDAWDEEARRQALTSTHLAQGILHQLNRFGGRKDRRILLRCVCVCMHMCQKVKEQDSHRHEPNRTHTCMSVCCCCVPYLHRWKKL